MQEPQESDALIAIVDDDPSARQGLQRLVRSVGWKAETFASAQEFLAHARIEPPSCVVLDLQLPGLSGLDLQKRMAEAGLETPIVFLTGHGNIPASVQAMKAGAVEFLTKPFDEQDLLRATCAKCVPILWPIWSEWPRASGSARINGRSSEPQIHHEGVVDFSPPACY